MLGQAEYLGLYVNKRVAHLATGTPQTFVSEFAVGTITISSLSTVTPYIYIFYLVGNSIQHRYRHVCM